MAKTKLFEQKTKPEGYVLTDKGLKEASRPDKWPRSMDDIVLRTMVKSPGAPLTKDALSEDLWQRVSEILAKLEKEGLVQKAQDLGKGSKPHVELAQPNATFQQTLKDLGAKPAPIPKRATLKLGKTGFSDRKGTRISRRHHRGWKKLKY